MLNVLKTHKRRATSFAAVSAVAVVAATLGAGFSRAQAAEAAGAPANVPYADRLPNLVLKTHEGKNVRFYDDLIKGKIALINFMYVTCDGR